LRAPLPSRRSATDAQPSRRFAGDWGHTAAASRLCGELGLVSSHEQLVSDQIRNGLTRYESWVDAGRECLVPIEFDITLGRLRYRDRLMWDANEPPNKAGPDEFAQGVCSDLGLGCVAMRRVPRSAAHDMRPGTALTACPCHCRPEFAAAIAASMAEQQNAKRQAVLGDVVRGRGADKATPVVSAEELASLGPRLDWVDAPADAMEQ
jgi:hypothetical protein